MSVKIICINKDDGNHYNPHEAIEQLGWINESTNEKGKSTLAEMVKFLEGGGSAYVTDHFGNKAYLEVQVSSHGNKYVQTRSDGRLTNNLLELPECRV